MTYIPDNLGERRRADDVSQTAMELFIKYCECADKETGNTFANPKTVSDAYGMRSDNAQKYDKELQDKNWITLLEIEGRFIRKVGAGWIPQSQRKGKTETLNFRKALDELLNFRKTSLILGEFPKFKEKLLNFRKTYKEYIDQSINHLLDHLSDQIEVSPEGSTSRSLETDSAEVESEQEGKTEEPKREGKSKPTLDTEFIRQLSENPIYKGIDVPGLFQKMVVWCSVNGKQPTRRRFVNWLNREDKPMEIMNGSNQNLEKGYKPEPNKQTEQDVIAKILGK